MTPAGAAGEAAPASRPRPARRAATDLTFIPDAAWIEARAASEPDWLAADRRDALARFASLPVESDQLYTPYVDLRNADLADVTAHPAPATVADPSGAAAEETGLPAGAAAFASFREDRVLAIVLDDEARAAGVMLEPLAAFIARDPETARRLLVREGDAAAEALPETDRLAQLTRAAWNQGLVVRVPDHVRLARPIVVRWAAGAPGRALLTRTIVELGVGASASLLEELVPSGAEVACAEGETVPQALFTATLELHLGARSELAVAGLQELGPRTVTFQHRRAFLGAEANLRWALAQLGGRLVRSRVDNRLEGDRCAVEQVEIVFGAEDQLFDLTSYTRHVGRDTTGNLLSKGALLDRSRSFMKGLITIERSAIGTDSFLGEFGMNLSKATRAVAIPSLEIDQPDCRRAAHSSSVGPIDESQVFYLESRGIPPDEARKFIVLGFLEPVVARVPLAEAQDRLRERLEAKWAASIGAGEPAGGSAAA
jgi:Fe-S cluster assembly scaffold protein SufB